MTVSGMTLHTKNETQVTVEYDLYHITNILLCLIIGFYTLA